MVVGEDTFISYKDINSRLIYHIRFHLSDGMTFNFTNNKKNIILRTKFNNIWIFKSDIELIVEDSIIVDNNITKPSKQIVIKGLLSNNKVIKKWSIENIDKKYALISVFDKSKLKYLCANLKKFNYEFISSGSTGKKFVKWALDVKISEPQQSLRKCLEAELKHLTHSFTVHYYM